MNETIFNYAECRWVDSQAVGYSLLGKDFVNRWLTKHQGWVTYDFISPDAIKAGFPSKDKIDDELSVQLSLVLGWGYTKSVTLIQEDTLKSLLAPGEYVPVPLTLLRWMPHWTTFVPCDSSDCKVGFWIGMRSVHGNPCLVSAGFPTSGENQWTIHQTWCRPNEDGNLVISPNNTDTVEGIEALGYARVAQYIAEHISRNPGLAVTPDAVKLKEKNKRYSLTKATTPSIIDLR